MEDNNVKKGTQSPAECCEIDADNVAADNVAADTFDGHGGAEGNDEHGLEPNNFRAWLPAIISFCLLAIGLLMDYVLRLEFFTDLIRFLWYAIAYLPVGYPVIKKGVQLVAKGEIFTEFLLMSIATIGAFVIGQYPEGIAVMLFYAIGELFQDGAVSGAKRSIKALLDIRPDSAEVLRSDNFITVAPNTVDVDEVIRIKAGEKVPLDGVMLSKGSSFNTAALTGESKPNSIQEGEVVLAGMVNMGNVIQLKVTKRFEDSSLARILFLVQEATQNKAPTEQFLRKFAKVYTPIVVYLAVGLTFGPYLFVEDYVFADWFYRALIFLVISCPCALVISIPLGYFGGIGAASRNGILFKGSNYLDLITRVNTIVMDKTGTLTKGVFNVQEINSGSYDVKQFMHLVAALESASTHPIAKAVTRYAGVEEPIFRPQNVEEISGHGLKGTVDGKEIMAGNRKLMDRFNIQMDDSTAPIVDTVVFVAIDNQFTGYFTLADELKEDAAKTVQALHARGIREIVMLSGDKEEVVQKVAESLGIDRAFGGLLPEQKVDHLAALKATGNRVVAFIGDGINDAPVLALADVGIAMGGLGSDAAIETADVIIQNDQPSKILTAVEIGKATRRIVWQNIALAFGVKLVVLVLGAGGLATMWEAVFADVGVSLLAILNAMRLQKRDYSQK